METKDPPPAYSPPTYDNTAAQGEASGYSPPYPPAGTALPYPTAEPGPAPAGGTVGLQQPYYPPPTDPNATQQYSPQYPPPGPQVGQTTVNQTTVVVTETVFGPSPQRCYCTKCATIQTTKVKQENAAAAYLLCGVICLLGGWLGCCLIPFCCQSLKTTIHKCPQCGSYLGKSH